MFTPFDSIFKANCLIYEKRLALSYDEQHYTYEALHRRSNQLAYYLLQRGVKKNAVIAIVSNNYLERIVSILALWRLGAAYLPLDPNYPLERISFILNDAKIKFAIVDKVLPENRQFDSSIISIFLEDIDLEDFSTSNLLQFNAANDIAYIAYTSGSTGRPKGAMVTHANLMSIFKAWELSYELAYTDVHLQMANFGFDVCSGDIIRALGSGARLVICSQTTMADPAKLYTLLEKQAVTVAEFTPSRLRNLCDYLDKKNLNLSFMRLLICGSDSWSLREYKKARSFLKKAARLVNSYGTTETTIDSTYFETTESFQDNDESLVPLGKPFSNTIIKILDQNQQECPNNVPGEVYIGGGGVSSGYFNQLSLTKEKFIHLRLFGKGEAVSLFYKTGDLGFNSADGNLHFVGRLDYQIKIMDYRLDLLEVETILKQHHAINDAVIVSHSVCDSSKKNILIAFIIPEQDFNFVETLEFIKKTLPNYAIPSLYFSMQDFPISSHGKLDRLKLQSSLKCFYTSDTSLAIKNNNVDAAEKKLLNCIKKVFNTQLIGNCTSFFYLDENTFLIDCIFSELKNKYNVSIPEKTFLGAYDLNALIKVFNSNL